MNKAATDPSLLRLLVRVYNQTIQCYYYFPDVIICGDHRLEREEFELLLTRGCVEPFFSDSFGKLYHTTKKAEQILLASLGKRRQKSAPPEQRILQTALPFA